jgi:hypothetical protein
MELFMWTDYTWCVCDRHHLVCMEKEDARF